MMKMSKIVALNLLLIAPFRLAESQVYSPGVRGNGVNWSQRAMGGSKHLIADAGNISSSVETIRQKIRDLIREDRSLAPKFLRLEFHDCVGGCDGCVDLSDPDNNGLDVPISALSGVVSDWKDGTISRADIWALAAMTGAEMTQAQEEFHLDYVGRIDCEDSGKACLDTNQNSRECREDLGDARAMPGPDLLTHEILDFFRMEFGFTAQEVVALMGAHSVGSASKENSGFDGPVGWDDTNYFLDIDYYRKLIGGGDPTDLEDLMEASPGWTPETIDNNDSGADIPDRVQWFRRRSLDARDIISLNTDIGLCRDLSGAISTSGDVSCSFKQPNRCPHAASTMDWMAEYRFNETKFLQDFQNVMKKMIVNGYEADSQLMRISVPPTGPAATDLPRISTPQSTYASGETVTLSFSNPYGDRVWIAVWPASSDPQDLNGSPEAWAWPCGDKSCSDQSVVSGKVTLQVSSGLWRAYMMTDMASPYEAAAYSIPFSVGDAGISSARSSYTSSEPVTLAFSNPIGTRVWFAVWPADADAQNLVGPIEAWAWPCGSTDCNGDSLTSGSFNLSVGEGNWKAFMMYDMYSPYKSVASTKAFTVGSVPIISASKNGYNSGENVTLSFVNPDSDRIWIAIWPANSNANNLRASTTAWAWPCGTKSCSDKSLAAGSFDLSGVPDGEWRAYLMTDMHWPYQSKVYTDTFIVGV